MMLPSASEALAEMVMLCPTVKVALLAGAVSETVGAVLASVPYTSIS